MSTDSAPSPTSPPMPTSVRVAVVAMGVLAALLLLNAALLGIAFDEAVDRILEEVDDVTRDEARNFVLLALVPYLVVGVVLALAAVFLPRRQPWARWVGIAAAALLAMLTLFNVLATGGITVSSLLVVVLAIAALTSLLARTTRDWVPSLRSS